MHLSCAISSPPERWQTRVKQTIRLSQIAKIDRRPLIMSGVSVARGDVLFPEIRRFSQFTQPARSVNPKLRAIGFKQLRQTFCEYFAQSLPWSALQQPES